MMVASLIGFVCVLFEAISDSPSNDVELLLLPKRAEGVSTPVLSNKEIRSRACFDWLLVLDWLLFNLAASSAVIITLGYWVFVYWDLDGTSWLPSDIHLHVVNTVLLLVEVILSAIPMQLLHVIYPMIMGTVYVTFSVVYWATDKDRVLYPEVLDWNKPDLALPLSCVAIFMVVPTVHTTLWALCKLRNYMYARIYFGDEF